MTIDPGLVIESKGEQGIEETLPGTLVTDLADMTQPYGIYVNPYTGYIYGTDAGSYDGAGFLYQWTPQGELMGKHKVYINPGHFLALAPEGYWSRLPALPSSTGKGDFPIYDIKGRRINPQLPIVNSQLYIRNGKKILYK